MAGRARAAKNRCRVRIVRYSEAAPRADTTFRRGRWRLNRQRGQ